MRFEELSKEHREFLMYCLSDYIKAKLKKIKSYGLVNSSEKQGLKEYYKRFCKYSFSNYECDSYEQYEGYITRLYHTVENG